MSTKRLTDLYVTGRLVEFGDPESTDERKLPDITVWLQKLMPFEQELAMSRAQVERAKGLTIKYQDENSDERLVIRAQLREEFTREEIINLIASEDLSRAKKSSEAEVGDKEEWTEDDYLNGLKEAWEQGASESFHGDDDPRKEEDAKNVFEGLKRFADQVEKDYHSKERAILGEWERKTDEQLYIEGEKKLIELRADMRWLTEYKKCEVWLATRDPKNHGVQYFTSRAEVDRLHPVIFNRLQLAYQDLLLDPDEVKE